MPRGRSGYTDAENLKQGTVAFTSGQQTASVSYNDPFREDRVPSVLLTRLDNSQSTANVFVSTSSETGFTAKRSSTGETQDLSYFAIDKDA